MRTCLLLTSRLLELTMMICLSRFPLKTAFATLSRGRLLLTCGVVASTYFYNLHCPPQPNVYPFLHEQAYLSLFRKRDTDASFASRPFRAALQQAGNFLVHLRALSTDHTDSVYCTVFVDLKRHFQVPFCIAP